MRYAKRLAQTILLLPFFLIVIPITQAKQGGAILPADLLIVTSTPGDSGRQIPTLTRINATTFDQTVFFRDEQTFAIRPLFWSPRGQYLAVLRRTRPDSDRADLCLIEQTGALHTCFEDVISAYLFGGYDPHRIENRYRVTWSHDERYIYFVHEEGDQRLTVVEGKIASGNIEQILYRFPYPYGGLVPGLYWTPDLTRIAVFEDNTSLEYLYLDKNQQDQLQPIGFHTYDLAVGELSIHAPVQLRSIDLSGRVVSWCPGFSPLGNYMIARVYDSAIEPAFVLTDVSGTPIRTIDLSTHDVQWIGCPAWQPDEAGFYFLTAVYSEDRTHFATQTFYHFDVSTSEVSPYALVYVRPEASSTRWPDSWTAGSFPSRFADPAISDDGVHLAFIYTYSGGRVDAIGVAAPTGEVIKIDLVDHGYGLTWFPTMD